MQQSQILLRQQAIDAAKMADWTRAIELNSAILQQNEQNVEAMNRLGLAYLKSQKINEAKKVFQEVLALDKSNIIANKHLKCIKNNEVVPDVIFSSKADFIEEPGRSKVVSLHRLTSKVILQKLKVGQNCSLQLKNRYISITDEDNHHIGALPEDLSFRLSNLIKTGNKYSCVIYKVNDKECAVQIKELERAKRNAEIQSFPSRIQNKLNSLNEDFSLDEDVPFEIEDDFAEGGSDNLDMSDDRHNR